tara:strand:- start:198 stop:515 length:318 start_codon:yes stop_codon:yes gene_type:complete
MTYSYDSFGKHYMQEASGHYFTEHLPDGWDTWEREELDKWCEDNAWQPFEYHPTDWVFEQVSSLARTIDRLVVKATKPLEDEVAECEQEIERLRKRLRILHGEEE